MTFTRLFHRFPTQIHRIHPGTPQPVLKRHCVFPKGFSVHPALSSQPSLPAKNGRLEWLITRPAIASAKGARIVNLSHVAHARVVLTGLRSLDRSYGEHLWKTFPAFFGMIRTSFHREKPCYITLLCSCGCCGKSMVISGRKLWLICS